MIRSILAVVAGYAAMVVCVMLTTAIGALVFLGEISLEMTPTPAYLAANLVGSLLAAIAGGYVAAWIPTRAHMSHAWVLAAIVAVTGAVSALAREREYAQLGWYPYVLLVVGVVGVALGGKLRAGRVGNAR